MTGITTAGRYEVLPEPRLRMRRRTPLKKLLAVAVPLGIFYVFKLLTSDLPLWAGFSLLAGVVVAVLIAIGATSAFRRRQRLIVTDGWLILRRPLRDRRIHLRQIASAVRFNVAYTNVQTGAVLESYNTFLLTEAGTPLLRLREQTWSNEALDRLLAYLRIPLRDLPGPRDPSEAAEILPGGFGLHETRPLTVAFGVAFGILAVIVVVLGVVTWLGYL